MPRPFSFPLRAQIQSTFFYCHCRVCHPLRYKRGCWQWHRTKEHQAKAEGGGYLTLGVEEGADRSPYVLVLRRVAWCASLNYVLLLPTFPEALIFNLPFCTAYWNRRAKRNRSFLHARAILTQTTLDEPPNWENV